MNATVKKVQQKLIQKAKQKGLYENFGQDEVCKLLDHPKCNVYGTPDERAFHASVQELDIWAQNYCG